MSSPVPQPGPAWPLPMPDQPAPERGADHRRRVRLLALAGVVAALGIPLGLLWAGLAPDVPIRVTDNGPVFADPQPEQLIAADGWFTILAIPFGALAAFGAWRLSRDRGPAALMVLVAGALIAGVAAWLVGRQVGLSGYEAALADASPGAELARPPDLRVVASGWWPPLVAGVPVVPALVAAVVYTLFAAWSRFPTLRPERPPLPPTSQHLDARDQ